MLAGKSKVLYYLVFMVAALSVVAAATGVFYTTGGAPFEVVNQYGETIIIYGDGIYAHDSYFKAPIFRGTDLVVLMVGVPLLLMATILDIRKRSLKTSLLLTSLLSLFLYYAISIAFGVTYNSLLLIYIALFSASLFGLILAMIRIDYNQGQRKHYSGIARR